jgi:hypothetical protein
VKREYRGIVTASGKYAPADIRIEIQQRDDARHASLLEEIGRLEAVTARVDQLEKENHALVRELDQLRRKQVIRDATSPESSLAIPSDAAEHPLSTPRPALAELSANSKIGTVIASSPACGPEEEPDWQKECSKLVLRHSALEQRHEDTRSIAKRMRESRDSWTVYAQSLEAKVEKLEKKLQRNENTDDRLPIPSSARPRPARVDISETLSGITALGSDTVNGPTTGHGPHEDAAKASMACEGTTRTPEIPGPGYSKVSTDEETQDGSDGGDQLPTIPPRMASQPAVAIKEEPSSDTPVIVSERTVRKRKHIDDGPGMAAPRRIKSEQSPSSDPVVTGEAPVFHPHESIDLDEEERGMPTPRKQRPSEINHLRSDDGASPVENEPPVELRSARHHRPHPAKKQLDSPSRGLNVHPDRPAASGLSAHKLSRTDKDGRSPIKPRWTMGAGIADVAEEAPETFNSPKWQQGAKEPSLQTPAQGRLHSLLNEGSPKKTPSFLSPARRGRDTGGPLFDKENIENMLPEEVGQFRDAPVKPFPTANASPATPLRRHGRDRRNPPKASRLRDRPPADLRPEDFKVNPKSNNGYKHAFGEVVRNREERSELAGCTDPNCCGRQFRVMAESELSAGGPGILSRVADISMMENYLGNEAYQLDDMTRVQRQEVWLKAKIQDLADRYGRHRHRFARRPSPPGYWNPDFPSTQEIEKRKEEAERVERGLVEERWREAMRGGGRWLFRDE